MKRNYPINSKQTLKFQQLRLEYLNSGIESAKNNDPLHIKACILYWAEGSKSKNIFQFTNCEPETHKIIISYVAKYFPFLINKITGYVNFYPDETNTYEKVQNFWIRELDLKENQFRQFTDRSKYYPKPENNKFTNGILKLQINSTELLFNTYGAINHYCNKELFSHIRTPKNIPAI